jgi:hypothetical protein
MKSETKTTGRAKTKAAAITVIAVAARIASAIGASDLIRIANILGGAA